MCVCLSRGGHDSLETAVRLWLWDPLELPVADFPGPFGDSSPLQGVQEVRSPAGMHDKA